MDNQVLILERKGSLDREVLERVFSEIGRRHTMLRATFTSVDGIPVQTVSELKLAKLAVTDLSGLPAQRRKMDVSQIADEAGRQPFNLVEGTLMRCRLLRLSQEDHLLIVTLPTIVADEWSMHVLARELDGLYAAYAAGEPSPLADLPVQYADYAQSQRSGAQGSKQEICYWEKQLVGIPPALELPTDRPRLPQQGFHGSRQALLFSKDLSDLVWALSDREGVELFTILLAAFQVLLFRYSGQDCFVLGTVVHGRNRVDTHGLIGRFAQTAPVRADLGGDPSFRELMRRVDGSLRGAREHQNVSFERLFRELRPKSERSGNPLFRVLFSQAPAISQLQSGWEPARFEASNGTTTADLQVQLYDRRDSFVGRVTYDSNLFDAATITRMGGHFDTLLQSIATNPDQSISRLRLLTCAERHQLLVEWNGVHKEYRRDRCVHQLVEEQAGRVPDAMAVLFEGQQLTYRELNRRANQLAHHLRKLGVGPNVLVGLCLERSLEMVVGLLGILKAGAAYVPLDPAFPRERLVFMLEDANVAVLVTEQQLLQSLPTSRVAAVCLDTDWQEIAKESGANPASEVKPENLAYVIYTSGSTGKPKGVQIPHRAVVNFLTSMSERPGMTERDCMLAVTTLSFDIAGLEIYLPLSVGASVDIVSRTVASDGNQLLSKLDTSSATVMQATPATWRMLLEAGWRQSKNLKILCGGEALPRDLANELATRASSVWNMYGPTETTIWSTISQIISDGPVTIGRPIANTEAHVLDSLLEPVPVGVPGELYIGGDGLALGYLHRPELTAERFIPHPFRDRESGARLYRTGDLARLLANGEIECMGRIDNQVKIRGFRIELGEIESVLGEYRGVRQNVVVAREYASGDKRLVAYLAVHQEESLTADQLRLFLKRKLPDYMVPSQFVFLEALPLTPNGKVDRRALPPAEGPELTRRKELIAPRDNIESKLAEIWESILGIRNVGVKDNFFELGGHSLLVAKLIRRIEQAFEKKLSMAAIFEAPTIEQQAGTLSKRSPVRSSSAVLPIQPIGSRPPLFCFGFGAGPVFLPLARRLGPDQPLLGVDPTLLETSQLPVSPNMEGIAACLARLIRGVQPGGPYYLGGLCGGGLVAYETACQLAAEGQQVGFVALFEPHPGYYDYYEVHSNRFGAGWLNKRLKFHLGNLQQLEFKEAEAYIRDHLRERSTVLFDDLKRLFRNTVDRLRPRTHNGQLTNIRDILGVAYRGYRPRPFAGAVLLFQATRREPGGEWERQYWAGLANRLETHEIPGYSNWLVRFFVEPNVEMVANKLRAYLHGFAERGNEQGAEKLF